MAITKVAAPLSGIRGTIGGITYSANKAGTYAKSWAPATNPRTNPQAVSRTQLAQAANLWQFITAGQRSDWDDFAALPAQAQTNALGETYYLSGFQWFCKVNARLFRCGMIEVEDAPTGSYPTAPTIDDFRVCTAGSESDQCTGGTPTGSTERAGQEYAKAFDDDTGTYWQAAYPNTTGWIGYTFAAARNIKRYRIYFYQPWATQQAASWTFQVYSGGGYVTLHTITNWTIASTGWQDFYVANSYDSTQYRVNITANGGHATSLLLLELEMYDADVGASCICYPQDTFENGTVYIGLGEVAMSNSAIRVSKTTGARVILATHYPGQNGSNIQSDLEEAFGTILEERAWFLTLRRLSEEGLSSPVAQESTVTIEAP